MTQQEIDQILLDLKSGQEKLFKGQEERDQILLDLKSGQEKLFKGQEELLGRVENLEAGQEKILGRVENLENEQEEMKSDLRSLSQTVAKIEIEHGEKLGALLDGFASHNERFESIEKILDKHENKLDRHSDEIYYLNSKVHEF